MYYEYFRANLANKENVNYLLSHPVMQDLIMYNYDFTDEEIVDYYISLLKSLALRIDEANLQLFFNQRMSLFPLLWQATKFYNHKEIMVRTAVRTIILGVMKSMHYL
jgi:protein CLEC16A